jgi:ureidoglycolate hydrolase
MICEKLTEVKIYESHPLVTSTGIHMTTEVFLEVDAEKPVFSEMTTVETAVDEE